MSPSQKGQKLTNAEMNPTATYGLGAAAACTKVITIKLTAKGVVNHRQPVKVGDCIRWRDQTGQSRTLKFDSWPFSVTRQDISVPASGYSNTFQIAAVPYGSYPYVPSPGMVIGPPNPPDLVVGG